MSLITDRIESLKDPMMVQAIKEGFSTLFLSGIIQGINEEAMMGIVTGSTTESAEDIAQRIVNQRNALASYNEILAIGEKYKKELSDE